jgi:hypothetical protein
LTTIAQEELTVLNLDVSTCVCNNVKNHEGMCQACRYEMEQWLDEQAQLHEDDLLNMAAIEMTEDEQKIG